MMILSLNTLINAIDDSVKWKVLSSGFGFIVFTVLIGYYAFTLKKLSDT